MLDAALYRLSVPFALVTGTGAGILSILSWRVLHGSPFERALQFLVLAMAVTTTYHAGLITFDAETRALQSILIVGYALIPLTLLVAAVETNGELWNRAAFKRPNLLLVTVLGLLLYSVGGPLAELFVPQLLHWTHGVAALLAIGGLCLPVDDDLRNEPWNELLLADPPEGRDHPQWMTPMDDAILELLYSSELVLTPAVIAYNIDFSREEVNRRLSKLESEGFVERVDRGKYRLAGSGQRYLVGEQR